jgi:2-methylcitrate dehydratase PrpD
MAKYLDTKSGSLEEAIKQVNEKSVSQAQQKAAGAALSAKRGEISPSELVGASKEMYDGMTEKELEDFAKTKHKGLPKKVEEARQLKDPKKETMVSKKGKVD